MATLFIGRFLWPLEPPLRPLRRTQGDLVVFLPTADATQEALTLLDKMLEAIHYPPAAASVWLVSSSLSPTQLSVFSERVSWILGALVAGTHVAPYSRQPWRLLKTPPPGWPEEPVTFVLPSLPQLLSDPEAKKRAWAWIRPLALRSSK
ncbi:MAG: hypothetical protein D6750_09290 [Bacteroidetes bacterium]|nr:MAG: hypothetical protein D6750_09290 [Bacteroidota bacterium]